MIQQLRDALEAIGDGFAFLYHMLRPRAIRGAWRLGSYFECANWSYDFFIMRTFAAIERWKR